MEVQFNYDYTGAKLITEGYYSNSFTDENPFFTKTTLNYNCFCGLNFND